MADVDPSLSLTAQGLWSDEESLHSQPSDQEDGDPSSTTAQPARKVPPSSPVSLLELTVSRAVGRNTKSLLPPKSRASWDKPRHCTQQAISRAPEPSFTTL